jgi:hypothetical protein
MNPLDIVLQILGDAEQFRSKVNQACTAKGLPPAFDGLQGNTDYRFEGFGVAFIRFQPNLTFWVHYKPDSPQHVSLGKFEIPISYAQSLNLVANLGHPSNTAIPA